MHTKWSQKHSISSFAEENHSKLISLTSWNVSLCQPFCFVWIMHYWLQKEWIMLNYFKIAKQSGCLKHQDHQVSFLCIIRLVEKPLVFYRTSAVYNTLAMTAGKLFSLDLIISTFLSEWFEINLLYLCCVGAIRQTT